MLDLHTLIAKGETAKIKSALSLTPASSIAMAMVDLSWNEQAIVIRLAPNKIASEIFNLLDKTIKTQLLKAFGREEVAAILNHMAPDDRTEILEESPANLTKELLALLSPAERSIALSLLGYPKGSVGRLMTPDYIELKQVWTVQQVLDYVREVGHDSETLSTLYVVNEEGKLIDDLSIRVFLLAPLNQLVKNVMDHRFVALKVNDSEQTAINVFLREDRKALPVTDTSGTLIGIVTIDDILKLSAEKATKQIHNIGGLEALDAPYMTINFWSLIKKRASWLIVLFIGEMMTATAMGYFEDIIAHAVVLALFVPLIISSGGNSGSQATTLVIRALALQEVKLKDWWQVMRREIFSGLTLGSILGLIGFMRIAIWSSFSDLYGPHWQLVGLTVGLSLVGIVTWGSVAGSMLPFILRRLGFDPATSSAPCVATLVDVTGIIIYFSVAMLLLKPILS